jgi:hypothetical protein
MAKEEMGEQDVIPGLEGYVCTFQCLTHCPFPDGPCIHDDPLIGWDLEIEYPEFFWWRLDHLTEDQKKELMEPGSDLMIITPDCLDEFYPEPPGNPYRCPRCLSTKVHFGAVWIMCLHCGYNEPLIDFPENVGRCHYEGGGRDEAPIR